VPGQYFAIERFEFGHVLKTNFLVHALWNLGEPKREKGEQCDKAKEGARWGSGCREGGSQKHKAKKLLSC